MVVLRNKIWCGSAIPLARTACLQRNTIHFVSRSVERLRLVNTNLHAEKGWPLGLEAYVNQLEDNKTPGLPRPTSLSVGIKVTLSAGDTICRRYSVCNNSSGVIRKIVLDPKGTHVNLNVRHHAASAASYVRRGLYRGGG